jgi:hypothetical protein
MSNSRSVTVAKSTSQTQTPEQTIAVGPNPFGAVGFTDNTVFISIAEGVVPLFLGDSGWSAETTIPMPATALGLDIDPNGMLLAVACQAETNGLVVFVDPCTRAIVGQVEIDGNGRFVGTIEVAFSLDGQYVFATNERIASMSVIRVNAGTTPSLIGAVPVASTPVGIAVDSNYVYVTSQAGQLQVIDISAAVTNPGASSVVSAVSAGADPVRVVLGATGGTDYAWVSVRSANNVLTFNKAALISSDPGSALVATTAVGTVPVGLLLFGGGNYLAVANSNRFGTGDGTMTVLDTNRVISPPGDPTIATIQTGVFPRQFGITPDQSTFFLTNYGSGEVMVFNVDQFQ